MPASFVPPNTAPSHAPVVTFAEIRNVTRSFPAEDRGLHDTARRQIDRIAASKGETGFLGKLAFWLATAQRRACPQIQHPRVALFAATHGIAANAPGGDAEAMDLQIATLIEEDGTLARLAAAADTDLRLYELALDRPSADSRAGAAMDEADTARAIAYGMMAVEPGVDILAVAALGIGATLAAEALGRALAADHSDPLALLAVHGGADIAAMLGAILAARLAGMPVILDGLAALAAGALAARLSPGGADHCAAASEIGGIGLFVSDLAIESVLKSGIDAPFAGVAALSLLKSAATLLTE